VITTDKQGRYEIEKRIYVTDPDHQSLVVRTTIRALKGRHTLPAA
jgi:glucoamylase